MRDFDPAYVEICENAAYGHESLSPTIDLVVS
jgi:hypothetical protein